MAVDLLPVPVHAGGNSLPAIASTDIIQAWLAGRNPRTLRAYAFDLSDFARFAGAATPEAAVDALVAGGPAFANRVALAYRADMNYDDNRADGAGSISRLLGDDD